MGTSLLKLLLSCYLLHAPVELRDTLTQVCIAWLPYHAEVTLRYCQEDECERVRVSGGGLYLVRSREIILSPDRIDPAYLNPLFPPPTLEEERYLLLLHEYGHALGLNDSLDPTSPMKQGWDMPWIWKPSEKDFQKLYEGANCMRILGDSAGCLYLRRA